MTISIGIDVAKAKLDIWMAGKVHTIPNEEREIRRTFERCEKGAQVVMEATGKYHRLAHTILHEMGMKVMVINPYQSRHYAKAMNVLCKTDAVDAKMLSYYGERMEFIETIPAGSDQEFLQDLSRHLDDLKKIKRGLEERLNLSNYFVKESLTRMLEEINGQIEATEKRLVESVKQDGRMWEKSKLLQSIPGIGEKTAIALLSYLKEMGEATAKEIGSLSGLAPMNNDSGGFKGKRRIRGGRIDVRTHLYMPVLGAATRHNQRLKEIYDRLVAVGKSKKVALTACMRKLVTWANAILASGEVWQEKKVWAV